MRCTLAPRGEYDKDERGMHTVQATGSRSEAIEESQQEVT